MISKNPQFEEEYNKIPLEKRPQIDALLKQYLAL